MRPTRDAGQSAEMAFLAFLLFLALTLFGSCSPPSEGAHVERLDEPTRGGVLRMVQESARSLDPADCDSVYESLPINQIFDGLVTVDPGLQIAPGLASTWTLSRDGKTYTFHLRPGVYFHDGAPLRADDVVFTFERLLAPDREWRSGARSYLSVIRGARDYAAGERDDLPGLEAVDETTVRIHLVRPYPSFLEVLGMDGLKIVPRATVERLGDEAFARSPVGTGPFRLASWDEGILRLEANHVYFGGVPYLDEVEIQAARDPERQEETERFFRGELDVVDVSTDSLERLSSDPRVRVHRYQELNLAFLGLCARHCSLDDRRVRQAIAHAIDRRALVADSPETRREAVGILPPGLPGYSPANNSLLYDPEESARLLAEAGHPGGKGLEPVSIYTTSRGGAVQRLLDSLREDLAAVGIVLAVKHVSWGEMADRIDRRDAPAFLLAWIADLPDPDAFLRSLFESGGASNFFSVEDEKIDALLARGSRELNPEVRAQIYRQLEAYVLDLAPLVPLYHTRGLIAMRREVHGLEPGPLGLAVSRLERVWIDQAEDLS